jgi:hypothetical protein
MGGHASLFAGIGVCPGRTYHTESSHKQGVLTQAKQVQDFLVQYKLMVCVLQTTDRLFNTHQQVLQQIEIVIQTAAGKSCMILI